MLNILCTETCVCVCARCPKQDAGMEFTGTRFNTRPVGNNYFQTDGTAAYVSRGLSDFPTGGNVLFANAGEWLSRASR